MFLDLPTGEEVKKNLLIVFAGNIGTEDAEKFNAWNTKATLILDHFDSVAEKIYFKFSIYEIERRCQGDEERSVGGCVLFV